jgi:hypothetical protein
MTGFRRFVGIDWSGAAGEAQHGIQVAEIEMGWAAPRLIRPRSGGPWSRRAVMELILAAGKAPTLFGIDFAFSIPWDETDDLFRLTGLKDARGLWELVDDRCRDAPHLYAGPIWSAADSPFRPYIFHHGSQHRGARYSRTRKRQVDLLAGDAISIYHMVGPQVGAGSFAGMRMLHGLAQAAGSGVAIWPFQPIDRAAHAVVEIYPSLFYRQAGMRRPRKADLLASKFAALETALAFHGAAGIGDPDDCRSVDQADALISAAALRGIASNGCSLFRLEGLQSDPREGWILGVPSGQAAAAD